MLLETRLSCPSGADFNWRHIRQSRLKDLDSQLLNIAVSRPCPTIVGRRSRSAVAPANRSKAVGLTHLLVWPARSRSSLPEPRNGYPDPAPCRGGSRYEPKRMDFAPLPRSEWIGQVMVSSIQIGRPCPKGKSGSVVSPATSSRLARTASIDRGI